MIKYLHEKGYEWDNTIDTDLLEHKNIRQYCHDNNIPVNWQCVTSCYYCSINRIEKLKIYGRWSLSVMTNIYNGFLER